MYTDNASTLNVGRYSTQTPHTGILLLSWFKEIAS